MNSFRPLVYLSVGAKATSGFCRDSGLVQGLLSPAIGQALEPLRITGGLQALR
jgi:hypothetical protein